MILEFIIINSNSIRFDPLLNNTKIKLFSFKYLKLYLRQCQKKPLLCYRFIATQAILTNTMFTEFRLVVSTANFVLVNYIFKCWQQIVNVKILN